MIENTFDYKALIQNFLDRKISVKDFERTYIDEFLAEKSPLGEEKFLLLDWLFAEVDAYTDLPMEKDEDPDDFINEDQLRESAAKVLEGLRELQK